MSYQPNNPNGQATSANSSPIVVASDQSNLPVTLATTIAGEDITNDVLKVEQRFSPYYIAASATTVIKGSAGFLHNMVVQGGTTGTIIIYDNTAASGTIIASFDTTNALATYNFDCTFSTGLTVVTSANTKVTFNYR